MPIVSISLNNFSEIATHNTLYRKYKQNMVLKSYFIFILRLKSERLEFQYSVCSIRVLVTMTKKYKENKSSKVQTILVQTLFHLMVLEVHQKSIYICFGILL